MDIIGHRGARAYAPENTLLGYQTALAHGVDVVDVDVVATQDKVLVGYHDLLINPDILCDEKGQDLAALNDEISPFLIKNLPFATFKKSYQVKLNQMSKYATWFPRQKNAPITHISSLQEIVDYVNLATNSSMSFQIEVKNDLEHPEYTYSSHELAALIHDFIVKNHLETRVKIQAFDWRILYAINQFDPKIKTAYLRDDTFKDNWQKWFAGSDIMKIAKSVMGCQEPLKCHPGVGRDPFYDIKKNFVYREEFTFQWIKALGGYSYEPEDNELTHENLQLAHALGLKVFVWGWPEHSGRTFNPDLMSKLITWGVDGITTDDPQALRKLYSAQKACHVKMWT